MSEKKVIIVAGPNGVGKITLAEVFCPEGAKIHDINRLPREILEQAF